MNRGQVGLPQLRNTYVTFMAAIGVYVLLGIQLHVSDIDRSIELSDTGLWIARLVLVSLGIAGVVVSRTVVAPNIRAQAVASPRPGESSRATFAIGILWLAFAEAVGIYGLLLFLAGGELWELFGFCFAALIAIAWQFPTEQRWAESVAALDRSRTIQTGSGS